MQAIRFEPRHMCSDLVKVRLYDGADPEEFVANLEDISPSGACLLLEAALLDGASIEVICSTCRLKGKVRYCRFVEIGYVVGVAFNERQSWSRERYEPQNLLELPDD